MLRVELDNSIKNNQDSNHIHLSNGSVTKNGFIIFLAKNEMPIENSPKFTDQLNF